MTAKELMKKAMKKGKLKDLSFKGISVNTKQFGDIIFFMMKDKLFILRKTPNMWIYDYEELSNDEKNMLNKILDEVDKKC